MKFDFETVLDRLHHDSIALDNPPGTPKEGFSPLPMWVADMNLMTAPAITAAIESRLKHPYFGYFDTQKAYYDAIITWHQKRNHTLIPAEAIGYENGVLGCLATALRAFTSPGEKLLVFSPCYVGFSGVLRSTGRQPVLSPLKQDENNIWRMDYADIEAKLRDNHLHFAIFCSPHNPTGRVWEKCEIEAFMALCKTYQVTVFSDEIWSDIVLGSRQHIPTFSVSDDAKSRTITAYAPSKTFNLAGLIGSYHVIFDSFLRDRMEKESDLTHYNNLNVLSQHALIGAYSPGGEEWLEELLPLLTGNTLYGEEMLTSFGVHLSQPQGTYMLYLDLTDHLKKTGKTTDQVLKSGWDVGVLWQDGRPFLQDNTIRMNLALPHSQVIDAFDRLARYVF